jgi:hypothetical protein
MSHPICVAMLLTRMSRACCLEPRTPDGLGFVTLTLAPCAALALEAKLSELIAVLGQPRMGSKSENV